MLDGKAAGDISGIAVSAADGINGDGVDDLIIGASDADLNGNNRSGRSYVVFGNFGDVILWMGLRGEKGLRR